MSTAYTTPGVYVKEIQTLPPSAAEVPTAIPAFIGYTQKVPVDAAGVEQYVARVSTLLEYTELFGGPKPATFEVYVSQENGATSILSVERDDTAVQFSLYYALCQFFANGGGSCYVSSAGAYGSAIEKDKLLAALAGLAREDEPTLLVLTDAIALPSPGYYDVCNEALKQCYALGDRFSLLDVPEGAVDEFRNRIVSDLSYGAAYTPYLETSQSYFYESDGVSILFEVRFANAMKVSCVGDPGTAPRTVSVETTASGTTLGFAATSAKLTIELGVSTNTAVTGATIVAAWNEWKKNNETHGFELALVGSGAAAVPSGVSKSLRAGPAETLDSIRTTNTELYNRIKARLTQERVTLPPTSSVAGIYASVDRDRGVWKAPANVAVSGVIGPTKRITDAEQGALNVEPMSGKSINALRAFTGKGTLVWGARTLLGNDNEWRYVPVRRLFILIEESARKATSFAVFEPNVLVTWLKVKGMVESLLFSLWERGALAGATPEAAYFVSVGLGKTMSTQDILEGRMNVDIGVAAVRPAEFIVLRFTHKLQEA